MDPPDCPLDHGHAGAGCEDGKIKGEHLFTSHRKDCPLAAKSGNPRSVEDTNVAGKKGRDVVRECAVIRVTPKDKKLGKEPPPSNIYPDYTG